MGKGETTTINGMSYIYDGNGGFIRYDAPECSNANYYSTTAPTCVVSVLGTEYRIYLDVPQDKDPILETCSGYCDKTVKRIVVIDKGADTNLADWLVYRKTVMRHEIIHAFLFESGIGGDCKWDFPGDEHPEHMVEWIAMQFPKILSAFQTVGAL